MRCTIDDSDNEPIVSGFEGAARLEDRHLALTSEAAPAGGPAPIHGVRHGG